MYAKRDGTLVSKDINMRLKDRALGLRAEAYYNDHVLDDSDLLYEGAMALPENFWTRHGKYVESWQLRGTTFYRVKGPSCMEFNVSDFVSFECDLHLYTTVRNITGKNADLEISRA